MDTYTNTIESTAYIRRRRQVKKRGEKKGKKMSKEKEEGKVRMRPQEGPNVRGGERG